MSNPPASFQSGNQEVSVAEVLAPRGSRAYVRSSIRWQIEALGKTALKIGWGPDSIPQTGVQALPERVVDAGALIESCIQKGTPTAVGRLGNDEFATLNRWRQTSRVSQGKRLAELLALGDPFFSLIRSQHRIKKAGIRPLNPANLKRFSDLFLGSLRSVDLLGSWIPGESFFSDFLENARYAPIRSLEPFQQVPPWTRALRGKRVLIIHPFVESIEHQLTHKREVLFPGTEILPDFEFDLLKPPRAHCNEIRGANHWFALLEEMTEDVASRQFDVALIGAGPFGLPLASRVRKTGRIGIQLGGVLQLLFGIRGRRWSHDPVVLGLDNEHWKSPEPSETPSLSSRRRSPYW